MGLGALKNEPLLPGGITGLAGSMLIVMFTYAGFEVIGLAASEAENPQKTIPKAIRQTVILLVGLYVAFIFLLLPLVPTAQVNENTSPIVMALQENGLPWVGTVMNVVLITAILSTMLAAMFALGRMIRSLAHEHMAPDWLRDKGEVPYRESCAPALPCCWRCGLAFLSQSLPVPDQLGRVCPAVLLCNHHGDAYLFSEEKRLPARRKLPDAGISVYFRLCSGLARNCNRQHALRKGTGARTGGGCLPGGFLCRKLWSGAASQQKKSRQPGMGRPAAAEFSQELSDFQPEEDQDGEGPEQLS